MLAFFLRLVRIVFALHLASKHRNVSVQRKQKQICMLCSGNLIVMSTRSVICACFPLPISISMSVVRRGRCTCAQHIRHATENWSILHVARDPVELNAQKKTV